MPPYTRWTWFTEIVPAIQESFRAPAPCVRFTPTGVCMDLTNQIILIASLVLFASVLAGALISRLGAPLLLVFLVIGMLLGEDGLGGIQFDDVQISHLFGSLALAVILFDGGLATPYKNFRVGLKPALGLATVGVLVTALITGLFAAWWLDLDWLEGLLLGAIVGSTDAAAVFSLLRSRGLELKQRVGATLEIESGSNDPMAVFLTVALIELILNNHQGNPGLILLTEFARQMGLGALVGIAGGFGSGVAHQSSQDVAGALSAGGHGRRLEYLRGHGGAGWQRLSGHLSRGTGGRQPSAPGAP